MRTLRIGMAQINTTVGDLEGNTEKMMGYLRRAKSLGVDLVTFPEMAVTGYPPEDLLLMPRFVAANLACLQRLTEASEGLCVITGFVDKKDDLYNGAAVLCNGALAGVYHKMYLPNYGVFDENRYFQSGFDMCVFQLGDVVFGVNICEDIWYPGDPTATQANVGAADMIINISASPYHAAKAEKRKRMLATRASDNRVIVVFNNLVGGQDELVFDGASVIFDQRGDLLCLGKQFEEDFIVADLCLDSVFRDRIHDPRRRKEKIRRSSEPPHVKKIVLDTPGPRRKTKPVLETRDVAILSATQEIYRALVLGVSDYVKKNGFKTALIGLSGGIDSSLVAALAVDALGKNQVKGVAMPSMFNSSESLEDAETLAHNLGIRLWTIPISETFQAYARMLEPQFKDMPSDVTEENLQARIRGNILMALSNKFGSLVLTTGNKSETSVGYCTLYGDMAGGFAVIKDVPKTLVYGLAEYRNRLEERELIPARIIRKPPSAELRPDQKDTDSLPPYAVLDPILQAYVEEDKGLEDLLAMGFDEQTVRKTIRLVDASEYKRRQSPPGIKITPRAFGKDRRLPISNRFRPDA